MYIRKLKLKNYKNFFNSEIDFKEDITTIIGENGTGKTNIFNAIRHILDKNYRYYLNSTDFSYELKNPNGHWIIISIEFENIPNFEEVPEAVNFSPNENNESIYTLLFRPNIIIRRKLYNLSKEYQEMQGREKENKKKELIDFINNIDIKNDYDIKKTVGTIFNFLNEEKYKEMVGNFDEYIFPNPDDIQEDSSLIGNREDTGLSQFLNITYIPAIRDVTSELIKDGNFFEKILASISESIEESKWENIKKEFNQINDELKSISEFTNLTSDILNTMNDTVGSVFSGDMYIDVAIPEDKNKIIKYFTLKGKLDEHTIDLYNKSLGENNIIYFALKMLQNTYQEGHTKKLMHLLIIEEPESHLHKHLQQTFLKGIEKNTNTQILLSTHSVHISESSKIASMVVLGKKNEKHCEVYNPINNLEKDDIHYLERYLDSVRAPILFSKNIILVEGTAELLYIDNILKLKYDLDLNKYGISVISMDNCFFLKISKLFNKDRLKKKCSILTDLDKDFDGNGQEREKLSKNRVDELISENIENDYVKIYTNDFTFEIELFSNNLSILKQYAIDRKIYKNDEIIEELNPTNKKEIIYTRILKIANKLGKGWLMLDFIEWLKEQNKDTIDKLIIPEYIIKALMNFFVQESYSVNTYNQMIRSFCEKNKIGEEDIKDEFMLYIKGLTNEK